MMKATSIVAWFSFGRRALVLAALATILGGTTAPALAQESEPKTFRERIGEYWHRTVNRMESGARAAGDEYLKVKDEAARASGPAREKLVEKMAVLSRKWAIAREKLATSVELHAHSLGEEYAAIEEKARKSTGSAREKLAAEKEKLHDEWLAARAKLEATLSSNMKSSHDEIDHLKEHLAGASESARAKLGPHLAQLRTEFHKDREKLTEYLEADMKRTRDEMEKLGETTSNTAREAREKLSAKYQELRARLQDLHERNKADEGR
ncbi:MAG: hypothetical protein ACYC61_05110 [Isosphaeraceae bacterium]